MTDNLYFLFLDEIYDSNLNCFRSLSKDDIHSHLNHWHFGLAGIYLPASRLNDLYIRGNRIKRRYYSGDIIFHYVDMLNSRDIFADLKANTKKFRSLKASLNDFIKNTPFQYDCMFVDKHELVKKYGIFDSDKKIIKIKKIGSNLFPRSKFIDYNLYLLGLRHLLVNFYTFLTNKKIKARGIIVAEARGKREDTELRQAFNKIYYQGVGQLNATDLRNIVLDLYFVPKTQNYIGTQLADLVLYPTYDATVPNHGTRQDHIIDFKNTLKSKMKNGVVVVP